MKKFTFLLALLPAMFLSSCISGDEITEVVRPNTFSKVYTIFAEDMYLVEEPKLGIAYYEYEFNEPALTNTVYDKGVLQAFLYYKKDYQDTMCPLPFSDFRIEYLPGGGVYQWQEQFTVEFQPYRIKFIQKISDYSSELPLSDSYDVMVRFLW